MQQDTVSVRRARREDFGALSRLIEALADYEKLDRPNADALERLEADGWPEDGAARFTAWIAEDGNSGGKAVGYAITFPTYSSFLALPTLYIEDLFVLPDCRSRGIGRAIMKRLAEEALRTGCGRIEWVVLEWNTDAQRFYDRIGGKQLGDWQYYRMQREEFAGLVGQSGT